MKMVTSILCALTGLWLLLGGHAQATVCETASLHERISAADTVMQVQITKVTPVGAKAADNMQAYQNDFRVMQVYKGDANSVPYVQTHKLEGPQRAFDDFSVSLAVGNQVLLMASQGQMASMNGCGGASQLWSTLTWDEKTYLWLYEHRWGVWAGVVLTLLSLAKKWRERRLRRAAQT